MLQSRFVVRFILILCFVGLLASLVQAQRQRGRDPDWVCGNCQKTFPGPIGVRPKSCPHCNYEFERTQPVSDGVICIVLTGFFGLAAVGGIVAFVLYLSKNSKKRPRRRRDDWDDDDDDDDYEDRRTRRRRKR